MKYENGIIIESRCLVFHLFTSYQELLEFGHTVIINLPLFSNLSLYWIVCSGRIEIVKGKCVKKDNTPIQEITNGYFTLSLTSGL